MKHKINKCGLGNCGELIVIVLFILLLGYGGYIWIPKMDKKNKIEYKAKQDEAISNGLVLDTRVARIGNCEYLETGVSGYNNFSRTHKGDCDNPIHPYNQTKLEK